MERSKEETQRSGKQGAGERRETEEQRAGSGKKGVGGREWEERIRRQAVGSRRSMRAGWEERSRRHWQGVGRKDQEAGSIIEQKEHESREWEARSKRKAV
jgi:hypothetical protein